MKYIILLLIGFATVSVLSLDKRVSSSNLQNNSNVEVSSIEPVSEPNKAETVKEPAKAEEATSEAKTKPSDVVKENPKNCDTANEWIYPDGSCHKKAGDSIAPESVKPATSGGCEAVYSYSGWDQRVAYAVCMGESGGNANAYNPEAHKGCNGSRGLFQIACVHADSTFDPTGNVNAAIRIYNASGWKPWGAFTSGKYLKYL